MAGLSELDRRQMTHWRPGRGEISPQLLAQEAAKQREQALYAQPTDPTVAGYNVSDKLPPHLRPAWRGMGILGEMLTPSAMKDNPGAVGAITDVASSVPITKGILAMAALPGSIKGIRAFHGSPHSFDRFDLSKIGTGEGAQAYGHGLYFAENEGVARSYRDALTRDADSQLESGQRLPAWVANGLRAGRNPDEYLAQFQGRLAEEEAGILTAHDPWNYKNRIANQKQMLEAIEAYKSGSKLKPLGSMYEVNINAAPEQFLDWDKPLSKQPSEVVGSLRNLGFNPDVKGMRAFDDALLKALESDAPVALPRQPADPLGQEIYRRTSRETYPIRKDKNSLWEASGARTYDEALAMVGGDKSLVNRLRNGNSNEAAEVLREAGIPGIKYLDQGSRASGDGSRNYVVFDDKLIGILRKYGIGPFAVGGAMAMTGGDQP